MVQLALNIFSSESLLLVFT